MAHSVALRRLPLQAVVPLGQARAAFAGWILTVPYLEERGWRRGTGWGVQEGASGFQIALRGDYAQPGWQPLSAPRAAATKRHCWALSQGSVSESFS